MGNKFYASGRERAAKVQELFKRIAGRYDLINDLQSFGLHRYWKAQMVMRAAIQPGESALDLCCGTGDVAFALWRAGAWVTGLDFTEAMLAQAARRKESLLGESMPAEARERLQACQFLCGDALRIPFPDASFDVVTISYGLRNLSDFAGGLREMLRVARPGGRLLVLDFGKPDNALWRAGYFLHLRTAVPLLGRVFCGDSETHGYILESLVHYPAQKGVERMMREMGCAETRVVNFLGGVASLNTGRKQGGRGNALSAGLPI